MALSLGEYTQAIDFAQAGPIKQVAFALSESPGQYGFEIGDFAFAGSPDVASGISASPKSHRNIANAEAMDDQEFERIYEQLRAGQQPEELTALSDDERQEFFKKLLARMAAEAELERSHLGVNRELPGVGIRRVIARSSINGRPDRLLNAFIDFVGGIPIAKASALQRSAHLIFEYDAQVQNGGHLQYFTNRVENVPDAITALRSLELHAQAGVLERAWKKLSSRGTPLPNTIDAFIRRANQKEFDSFDDEYDRCSPTVNDLFQRFIDMRLDEFIIIE